MSAEVPDRYSLFGFVMVTLWLYVLADSDRVALKHRNLFEECLNDWGSQI